MIIRTHAARLIGDSQRTRDALEGDTRVVGPLEPVEAPVAAGFEGFGEGVAAAARGDAAVLRTPPGRGGAVLLGAAVEDAEAAARHLGGVSFGKNWAWEKGKGKRTLRSN
jgi:hypothetical protein